MDHQGVSLVRITKLLLQSGNGRYCHGSGSALQTDVARPRCASGVLGLFILFESLRELRWDINLSNWYKRYLEIGCTGNGV